MGAEELHLRIRFRDESHRHFSPALMCWGSLISHFLNLVFHIYGEELLRRRWLVVGLLLFLLLFFQQVGWNVCRITRSDAAIYSQGGYLQKFILSCSSWSYWMTGTTSEDHRVPPTPKNNKIN